MWGKIGEIMKQITSKYKTQNVANVIATMEIGRLDINERERRVRRRELPSWMRIVCWQGPTY